MKAIVVTDKAAGDPRRSCRHLQLDRATQGEDDHPRSFVRTRHPFRLSETLRSKTVAGLEIALERSERVSVPVPPSKLIRKLSAYFGVLDIFERVPFRAGDPPRPVQHTLGVNCSSVQVAIFDGQTVLPLPRARHQTVKPFEQ
jgi:hypothetical protein